jgi:hypothetical protein
VRSSDDDLIVMRLACGAWAGGEGESEEDLPAGAQVLRARTGGSLIYRAVRCREAPSAPSRQGKGCTWPLAADGSRRFAGPGDEIADGAQPLTCGNDQPGMISNRCRPCMR